MTPEAPDYEAILDELARYDWLYIPPGYRVLHGPMMFRVDVAGWRFADVTFGCGLHVTHAYIPGIFSRMGKKRCSRCCDKLGFPRGIGSPKNDDECRRLLGLPYGEKYNADMKARFDEWLEKTEAAK